MATTLSPSTTLTPDTRMDDVLAAFPGARRALFARYHIGGCGSCSFSPEETLSELCARNEELPVDEVISHIEESHAEDISLLIEPIALHEALASEDKPALLDIRSFEEHEAVAIPGSHKATQELLHEILGTWDKTKAIVVYDHTGERGLDAVAYLSGHGFDNVKALRGGIDAYSQEADSTVSRYRIEFEGGCCGGGSCGDDHDHEHDHEHEAHDHGQGGCCGGGHCH